MQSSSIEQPLVCRGVRGATAVKEDTTEAILSATRELLIALIDANGIDPDDVTSLFFSATHDLTAEYPAVAARQLGWTDVAIMCGQEMDVSHGLPRCVRVLIHWNTTRSPQEIRHVYLGEAQKLRPDRTSQATHAQPSQ